MGVIDSLYKRIEAGREGKNIGIPTGLPDILIERRELLVRVMI